MTVTPVTVEELARVREEMIDAIVGDMPDPHRQFLISFEKSEPDWSLLGIEGADRLPAVKWRQNNLNKLTADKRGALVSQLRTVLIQTKIDPNDEATP